MTLFVVLLLAWSVGSVLLACTIGPALARSNPDRHGERVSARGLVTSPPPRGQAA